MTLVALFLLRFFELGRIGLPLLSSMCQRMNISEPPADLKTPAELQSINFTRVPEIILTFQTTRPFYNSCSTIRL